MVAETSLLASLLNPTEEHAMLRKSVREFVRKEVEPQAEEYDQKGELNKSVSYTHLTLPTIYSV